jgi:hypothetical protein
VATPRKEPHHIASVADLFLGKSAVRTSGDAPASPVILTFAVAAATSESFSRWITDQLRSTTAVRAGGRWPGLRWRHLDAASLSRLRAAEDEEARSWDGLPAAGCDGLVWCLEAEEADSWWAAYRLGWLARVLRPAQIKVLIRMGPADPEPSSNSPGSDSLLCARRCLAAAPGCLQEVLRLPDFPTAGEEGNGEGAWLGEFLGRLSGSLKLAALDLRGRGRGASDKLLGAVAGKG